MKGDVVMPRGDRTREPRDSGDKSGSRSGKSNQPLDVARKACEGSDKAKHDTELSKRFNSTLAKIEGKLNNESIPEDLKSKIQFEMKFLSSCFKRIGDDKKVSFSERASSGGKEISPSIEKNKADRSLIEDLKDPEFLNNKLQKTYEILTAYEQHKEQFDTVWSKEKSFSKIYDYVKKLRSGAEMSNEDLKNKGLLEQTASTSGDQIGRREVQVSTSSHSDIHPQVGTSSTNDISPQAPIPDSAGTQRRADLLHTLSEIELAKVEISWTAKTRDLGKRIFGKPVENQRTERVNKIVKQFNETLREIKGKLNAVLGEVKDKILESTITIIKDFKKSYDDALRGYGKDRGKGRTAREEGETKIEELNQRISEMSKDLGKLHFVQEARRDLQQAPDSYTVEERNSLYKHLDTTITSYERVLDAYQQGSDQPDAREQYERARQDFLEAKDQIDLRNMGKKLVEECNSILEHIKGKEGTIEYINNYEKYKQFICDKISTFIDKKYLYTSCKLIEEFKSTNKKVATQFEIQGFPDTNTNDKLEGIKRRYSDYSEKLSGTTTLEKKKPNEDAYFADEKHQVYAVFDGVTGKEGGSGGHIASAIAVDCLRQSLNQLSDELPVEEIRENMTTILRKINTEILKHQDGNYKDMATTASIVKVTKDGTAVIGNVGDSRVYLLKSGESSLAQLTLDHAGWVENASSFGFDDPWKLQKAMSDAANPSVPDDQKPHIVVRQEYFGLTECLGFNESIQPDIYTQELKRNDMLSITSDGVHDNLTDKQIADCILNESDPKKAPDALVRQAKEVSTQGISRSKPDDITAIVVKYPVKGANSARSNKDKSKAHESNIASTSSGQEGAKGKDVLTSYNGKEKVGDPSTSGSQETSERAEASSSYTAVHQSLDPSEHRISQEIPEINFSDNRHNNSSQETQNFSSYEWPDSSKEIQKEIQGER